MWNTAFGVAAAFGVAQENVDALEAVPPKDLPYGCCVHVKPVGFCSLETQEGCAQAKGQYLGDGIDCGAEGEEAGCPSAGPGPVPAVSDWGLVVMTLLVLVAATVIIVRSRGSKVAA